MKQRLKQIDIELTVYYLEGEEHTAVASAEEISTLQDGHSIREAITLLVLTALDKERLEEAGLYAYRAMSGRPRLASDKEQHIAGWIDKRIKRRSKPMLVKSEAKAADGTK